MLCCVSVTVCSPSSSSSESTNACSCEPCCAANLSLSLERSNDCLDLSSVNASGFPACAKENSNSDYIEVFL